jgi:hypothetical protein
MPVKLLSRMFRGKFLALLKASYHRGELTCQGRLESLQSSVAFHDWLSPLYAKEWVVYAKPPWNGPEQVLKYLARYTHRVAIANSRIQSIDNDQITFTYKDYRHEHRERTLALSAMEFIRRFLMHVIPAGFKRIRYYGFLANTHREEQLRKIRELLGAQAPIRSEADEEGLSTDPSSSPHDNRCPHCQHGTLWIVETTPRPRLSELMHLPLLVPT